MYSDFDTLLIPVESQVRELDGKLLLACIAAEKGYNVVFGSRAHIHFYASRVNNAIYVAKSMRRFSNRMFKILHGLGHRIVAWDEEALVRLPDPEYHRHRLSPITFKYIDHLFAWGDSNARAFEKYSGYLDQPIHIFGNPRIDVLRPQLLDYFKPEVDKIIEKYGNTILINTNFGQVNHFIQTQGKKEANRDKNYDAGLNKNYMSNRFSHKQKLFSHFKALTNSLSKTFPNVNFILRPHPSENIESWEKHLNKYDNAHVTNKGNVIPWILASKAIIINGCTTAIEASILGKPTLGYHPIVSEQVDDMLPKLLSDICSNDNQLIEKLESVLKNSYKINTKKNIILSKHIANLEGDLASDSITNMLFNSYTNNTFATPRTLTRAKSLLHNETRTLVKRFNSRKKAHRNSANYHRHRFPTISEEYLINRANRFSVIMNRFHNIKISLLSENIFSISL